jgi:hypothetical protein
MGVAFYPPEWLQKLRIRSKTTATKILLHLSWRINYA